MTKTLRNRAICAAVLPIAVCVAAQQSGPPAYVPVPPAPIAADKPKAEPEVAVPEGDVHFRVRLLDGRSSLPIANGRVRVWYDERDGAGYLLTTDARGEALLPAPSSPPLRVLVVPDALLDCRKLSQREAIPGYNLQQIAGKGLITDNRCDSGARAVPHPGELTLFARPPRWYEQLNRDAGR